jgi:hypothetical protein
MQEAVSSTVFVLAVLGLFGWLCHVQLALARNREIAIERRLRALAVALDSLIIPVLLGAVILSIWTHTSGVAVFGVGLMLVLFLSGRALNLSGRMAEKYRDELEAGISIRAVLAASSRRNRANLIKRWLRWRSEWVPNGFSAFRIQRIGSPFALLELGWVFRMYFVAVPVFMAAAVSWYAFRNPGSDNTNDVVLRIWIIFYVNMFAVTLMPLFVLSWLTIKYFSAKQVIRNQITLRQSVGILAAWSGAGAAIALVLGLLSFIPSRFLSSVDTWGPPQPFLQSAMADYSLMGGSIGFLAGLYQVVVSATRSMEDRLLAVLLPPVIMTAWTAIFAFGLRFTPRENAAYTLGLIKSSVKLPSDPTNLSAQVLTDWKTLLAVGGDSALSMFPDPGAFVLMIAAVATVWSFAVHLRKPNHKNTAASDQTQTTDDRVKVLSLLPRTGKE